MTPPHFQIGQEVEIIGPDKLGCEFDLERFIISMLWKDDQMYYSAEHQPWYPASSLRLVNEKPLSPMFVTYNYMPDDFEHGTIQVSCPCGRKAEIALPEKSEWMEVPTELKIGDFVEVIGPTNYGGDKWKGKIFKISTTHKELPAFGGRDLFSAADVAWYPAKSLRKLAPDEIAKHLAPPINTPQNQFNEKTEERLSVIESRLNELGPSHAELLGDVEKIAERIAANEKRLAILEGERPGTVNEGCEVSRSLYKQLMSDRPEATCVNVTLTDVCESQSKTFDNRIEALDWCKKALGIKQ